MHLNLASNSSYGAAALIFYILTLFYYNNRLSTEASSMGQCILRDVDLLGLQWSASIAGGTYKFCAVCRGKFVLLFVCLFVCVWCLDGLYQM